MFKNLFRSRDLAKENEELRERVAALENEKKDFAAEYLRVYLLQGCSESLKNCEQLIKTDEALKHFGEMWGKYKAETMMMLTAIEYEYIQNYDFTEQEIRVLKHALGHIGLFFSSCKIAHESIVEAQMRAEQSSK